MIETWWLLLVIWTGSGGTTPFDSTVFVRPSRGLCEAQRQEFLKDRVWRRNGIDRADEDRTWHRWESISACAPVTTDPR